MVPLIVWILILGLISLGVSRTPLQQGFKTLVYIICIVVATLLTLATFGISLAVPTPKIH